MELLYKQQKTLSGPYQIMPENKVFKVSCEFKKTYSNIIRYNIKPSIDHIFPWNNTFIFCLPDLNWIHICLVCAGKLYPPPQDTNQFNQQEKSFGKLQQLLLFINYVPIFGFFDRAHDFVT